MLLTSLSALRERLLMLGAKPAHVSHLLRSWLHARALDASRNKRPEHYLPLALRRAWPDLAHELAALTTVVSKHDAADGATRLLVALHDGQTVESVLLPAKSARPAQPATTPMADDASMSTSAQGLCVSTQVGCAVGCTFCKTGEGGLARQMGSAEIAAQLALARGLKRRVNKIVFMGMGEPAHNLDAVMQAISTLGHEGGIGHKNLVLSSVGDARLFDHLLGLGEGDVKPALALSLHTTDDAKRQALLPRAPRLPVAELVALGDRYARASGYPLQVQWTLIDGVNDGDDEINALVALLRGRHAMLNMIPYNATEGLLGHRRPSQARCDTLFHTLNRRGVLTRMRQSAGQDVAAGCGQLRSRSFGPKVIELRPSQ